MRVAVGLLALVVLAGPALAQTGSAIAVPPAPTLTPAPDAPVAPSAPNADDGATTPSTSPSVQPAPASTVIAPAPPDAPAPVSNVWLPAGAATLGVLNKVDGSTQTVTIAPGAQATVGDLMVSVQSCLVRPADQLPDAAVYLTVQPAGSDAGPAGFRGWMIRSAPGATVVGDAGEIFRVVGCS